MARGIIDMEGMNTLQTQSLKNTKTPEDLPFNITKIGHVVLKVTDLERSVKFYTRVPVSYTHLTLPTILLV